MKNNAFLFESVIPYAGTVHVAELLADIERVIKTHVVINDHAAAALAVWVLHTYTYELRDAVAYVAIESPEKRCGKTTLVSVLAAMAHKPLIASNITVGALFRAIDTCRPTLFIDEADTFLAGNGIMRGIINSGNTWRTAYVLRLSKGRPRRDQPPAEPGSEGGVAGLQRFTCWCPKVIALIGETPDTIADRSIVVKMSRKLVAETCAPLTELDTAEIKARCARFALDAGASIGRFEKIRGEGLNDRAADTFDPLYVITRHAGAKWEKKLHEAALALTAAAPHENVATELLLDILSIFVSCGRERMLSSELAATLRSTGGGLSSTALKDSAIDEFRIAKMLRPYGVRSSNIRVGSRVNKGYAAVDFREALKRYVPMAAINARLEELNHLTDLNREARVEREKEGETRKEALAKRRHERALEDLPGAIKMLVKLRTSRGEIKAVRAERGKRRKM